MQKELICFAADINLENNHVSGYAAKFGILSHPYENGQYARLKQDCFTRALENIDCTLNLDHDDSRYLARTSNDTLQLKQTQEGLWFDAEIAPTSVGNDAGILLNRKDYDACSFAVVTSYDTFEEDGKVIRELQDVEELVDIALVIRPRFPETEVQLHALEEHRKQQPRPLALLKAQLQQDQALGLS